jgi:hypothetical protein
LSYHVADKAEEVARTVSEATRQNATSLAKERGFEIDSQSLQVIEKGLVDAVFTSRSQYTTDPEVKTIIERYPVSDLRQHIMSATEEVISSILDYATITGKVQQIQIEDVDRSISELFAIWPFKRKKPPATLPTAGA